MGNDSWISWIKGLLGALYNSPDFFRALWKYYPAPLEVQLERIQKCHECTDWSFLTGQCRRCYCFVRFKVKFGGEKCPILKWGIFMKNIRVPEGFVLDFLSDEHKIAGFVPMDEGLRNSLRVIATKTGDNMLLTLFVPVNAPLTPIIRKLKEYGGSLTRAGEHQTLLRADLSIEEDKWEGFVVDLLRLL